MYLRISSNNCLLRCSTTDSRISWAGCFEVPAGTETDNDCTVARSIEYGLVPSSSGRAGRVTTPPPHIVYFTKDRFFARCVYGDEGSCSSNLRVRRDINRVRCIQPDGAYNLDRAGRCLDQ